MDAVPATPEPIDYSLSAADAVRLGDEWRTRKFGGNRKLLILGFAAYFIFSILKSAFDLDRLRLPHHDLLVNVGSLVSDAILVPFAIWLLVYHAKPQLAAKKPMKNRRLVFTPAGVEFTENGAFERVSWYAIAAAYDLPLAVGLFRRDDANHPLLIPKTALPDGGEALWSYLEVRLTGHRPAIRDLGFAPPKRLINVTDQFLADRGLTA